MKEREIFSALRTTSPCFIRLDGRSFRSAATALSLKKPFDEDFSLAMEEVSRLLLAKSGLAPLFAYTFSDEISLYLVELPFEGRIEKLDSVAASFAASALTKALDLPDPISFDARVVPVDPASATGYLIWRQKEAWRNHTNAYCQWALLQDGYSASEAQTRLHGMNTASLHDMMHARGINLAKTPGWQRRGILICRRQKPHTGYNPLTGEEAETARIRIVADRNPPVFHTEEGRAYLSLLFNRQLQD
ncbi:MAG: tRNA 5'-guanylyltransferase [Methanocalculus sp. MSAO_Arc1]|uniref:tRNA(His) guanylyltransferase Thg1 family protein n=1 Tax=Methanocalculus TaxID=71151 RepID=UPI000FF7E6A4|nr:MULTISPECIES: tRNA(His) guanylyltransferase Thg1 family protein [unclassified Methanocalculus]MCP1662203.1 tRNA(His) 5'-end guanylyltransferase [Methanocalculus sp. AMF5]RQD81661.1 MAG: tRNA 5'-guanylyltransferase [Methanocalculus sp. MSAO_Arc1]